MPAFYAHHQFGEEVSLALEEELKQLIEKNKQAFQIGLQGPDIFFFYRPWKSNDVTAYGHHLHETPARWLFQQGMKNSRQSAAYAYLMGAVCHYALDSMCHPYVAEFEQTKNVAHMEIESEFEKRMLRRNGLNPFTYRTDLLIPTDEETAEAVYQFYGVFDTEKMQYVLRGMQHLKRIFIEPRASRQKMVNKLLDISGFGSYKTQMLQLKDNPICAESNERLFELYNDAIPYATRLMRELDICKQEDLSLGEEWDKTFA